MSCNLSYALTLLMVRQLVQLGARANARRSHSRSYSTGLPAPLSWSPHHRMGRIGLKSTFSNNNLGEPIFFILATDEDWVSL